MGLFGRKRKAAHGAPLSRAECLARLRECMQKSSFSHELTDEERVQMDYSLQIITCFVRLNDCEDGADVRAIGFDTSADDVEEIEEDEDEDESEGEE